MMEYVIVTVTFRCPTCEKSSVEQLIIETEEFDASRWRGPWAVSGSIVSCARPRCRTAPAVRPTPSARRPTACSAWVSHLAPQLAAGDCACTIHLRSLLSASAEQGLAEFPYEERQSVCSWHGQG